MKIKIPKNLKKVRKVSLTPNDLITFEKKIQKVYENGDINAPVHLSSGNENELISIFQYVDKQDWVFSSWRNHYHALLHGMDENYLLKSLESQDSFEDEFDEIDEDNIDILMGEDTKGDGCDDNDFKFSFE